MARPVSNKWLWFIWGAFSLSILCAGAAVMAFGGPRHLFLIGKTTSAHHQMELACDTCHTEWFGGRESLEAACLTCHADELTAKDDSHPMKKFRDPRNAERLEVLDATKCLTCHVEHNDEVTGEMAVTIPADFCSACHQDIAEERPSHVGYGFETCASAGCHNYHDNRALYEDFLEKHVGEAWLNKQRRMSFADPDVLSLYATSGVGSDTTPASTPDAPVNIALDAHIAQDWLMSAHAEAGVNCSGCHQPEGANPASASSWIEKPEMAQCATCHANVAERFVEGKHGMRLAQGLLSEHDGLWGLFKQRALPPMSPSEARLPMKAEAAHKELTCNTCHASHAYDVNTASVTSCASCHNDEHTQAYFQSPHHELWLKEMRGEAPVGSGVACATCHMPKLETRTAEGIKRWIADHNQSANLRPNEIMGREVCASCHGMEFWIDSLADPTLISKNFKGRPSVHVESLDWVEKRMRERGEAP